MEEEECRRRHSQIVPTVDLDDLKAVSVLGRGAKGVVFLVRTEYGESYALKVISKELIERKKDKKKVGDGGLDEGERRRICFERDVLSQFHHPLFPSLRAVVDTKSILGYAIDYCPGRDLNSLRKKQTEKMFSDDIIRFYAAELVLALDHLHDLGIVYRDLKPENVMIQENGHLMLVDFDLSTKLSIKSPERTQAKQLHEPFPATSRSNSKPPKKNRRSPFLGCFRSSDWRESDTASLDGDSTSTRSDSGMAKSNSFVGTEEYVSPEVISGNGHDFSVDWWSLGILLYELLYGKTPFRGSNRKETFYQILTKPPELVGETTPLRDLIGKLLEKDPKQRITVEGIKAHEFFRGIDWEAVINMTRPPHIPVRPETDCVETAENKEIDIEAFVRKIFRRNCEGAAENTSTGSQKENGNITAVVEKQNQAGVAPNFLVF